MLTKITDASNHLASLGHNELTLLPYCRIYASVNQVNIGSDNGLSPGRPQAIIWTNARILLIELVGTKFTEILSRNSNILIQENAFGNAVCKMAVILSRGRWVEEGWARQIAHFCKIASGHINLKYDYQFFKCWATYIKDTSLSLLCLKMSWHLMMPSHYQALPVLNVFSPSSFKY